MTEKSDNSDKRILPFLQEELGVEITDPNFENLVADYYANKPEKEIQKLDKILKEEGYTIRIGDNRKIEVKKLPSPNYPTNEPPRDKVPMGGADKD